MGKGRLPPGGFTALLLIVLTSFGGAHTDGTVGPKQAYAGHFTVPAAAGQQRGDNLFHSFGNFDLAPGESATFAGPDSIRNVLVRVTGGTASTLDGALGCSIPNADLYLLNPAGVAFGPGASLDVKGSFAVSTADALALGKAGTFPTRPGGTPTLSSAAPSAFGFLASRTAGVSVTGASLRLREGAAFTVVAPSLTMSGGQLVAPAGRVTVVTPASAGTVRLNASHPDAQPDVSSVPRFGSLTLDHGSLLDVSGVGGGRVDVHVGAFTARDSNVLALTEGSRDGRGIDVASDSINMRGLSRIDVDADRGRGRGGALDVTAARSIVLDGQATDGTNTGFEGGSQHAGRGAGGPMRVRTRSLLVSNATIAGSADGPGRGSDVSVSATSIEVRAGGEIFVDSSTGAASGDLTVTARRIRVDDRGNLDTVDFQTSISAGATGSGPGGRLTVRAKDLTVVAGGLVSVDTTSAGRGGDMTVAARHVVIDGNGAPDPVNATTGISADTDDGSSGNGGSLSLRARSLTVRNGGFVSADANGQGRGGDVVVYARTANVLSGGGISADTSGRGRGGDLTLVAGSLVVDGRSAPADAVTSVSTDSLAGSTGDAGRLTLRAGTLKVTDGGQVGASTFARGRGGDLTVDAGTVTVGGRGASASGAIAGIFSNAETGSTGDAGDLTLRAKTLNVVAGGEVAADTFASGRGGRLSVTADTVRVENRGNPGRGTTGLFARTLAGATGDAGDVVVRARAMNVLAGGEVTTDTFSTGRGGNLTLVVDSLSVDGRGGSGPLVTGVGAQADRGSTGDAGNLTVRAKAIRIMAGGVVAASTFGRGRGGDLAVVTDALTVDGRAAPGQFQTGLFAQAETQSTGDAGNLTVRGKTVSVLAGGEVTADTFSSGRAGDLTISAGTVRVDGRGNPRPGGFTGIAAQAEPASSGAAGDLSLDVRRLFVEAGGTVSTNAYGRGRAGDLDVRAALVSLDGRESAQATSMGAFAAASSAGSAGSVIVHATGRLDVLNGAYVTVTSLGDGGAGDITVEARDITLDDRFRPAGLTNGGIFARLAGSQATGAGRIRLTADERIVVRDGAAVNASSPANAGGRISVSAGEQILFDRSTMTSEAGAGGGNVALSSPLAVILRNGSTITTRSTGGNGGNITIDPLVFKLGARSSLNANGGINGGNVTIRATATPGLRLSGPDANVTATGAAGVSGSVATGPATTDVTNAIPRLPASLFSAAAALQPRCGQGASFNSFVFTGMGGLSLDPQSWRSDEPAGVIP